VAIFRWINEGWSNPLLDGFFSFITDYHHFFFFLIPWTLYLLVWGKAKGRWLVLSIAVGLFIADQTSAHVLKPWIERLRPCNALSDVLTPAGKSGAYSFPSSHGSNMGVSMFLLAMTYRPYTWLFVWIAFMVGLSRIYLGLHYPSDVLSGYVLGILVGFGVWWAVEKIKVKSANGLKAGSLSASLAGKGRAEERIIRPKRKGPKRVGKKR